MDLKTYPVIDLVATGNNILRLRMERGLTVRELQSYFGFEEPRAIYKWQKGESLPTVDNLYALGALFEVPMNQILVPVIKLHSVSWALPVPTQWHIHSECLSSNTNKNAGRNSTFCREQKRAAFPKKLRKSGPKSRA